MSTAQPLLSLRNIVKSFGSVRASRSASVDVHTGEIVALLGDNGAGKSTLVKVIVGVHGRDSGDYEIEGKPASVSSPSDATAYGIQTVYQDPRALLQSRRCAEPVPGPRIDELQMVRPAR